MKQSGPLRGKSPRAKSHKAGSPEADPHGAEPLTAAKLQAQEALSDDCMARLSALLALLTKWQKSINLVGPSTLVDPWRRHILDSVQIADLVRGAPPGPWLDLGSGAGFPALVASLVTDRPVTCLESDSRKGAFLVRAAQEIGAPVSVRIVRIEQSVEPPASLITARALASLNDLLSLSEPLLRPEGICVFLKGKKANEELTAARKKWIFKSQTISSRSDPDGVLLTVEGLARGHD